MSRTYLITCTTIYWSRHIIKRFTSTSLIHCWKEKKLETQLSNNSSREFFQIWFQFFIHTQMKKWMKNKKFLKKNFIKICPWIFICKNIFFTLRIYFCWQCEVETAGGLDSWMSLFADRYLYRRLTCVCV